jgi:hypothetical protein
MDRPRDPELACRLFGSDPLHALALMRAAWPAAVGPELARRTEVVAFDSGVLRVRVPDERWRRGLARMRGDILVRLRRIAGRLAPRSLGFVEGQVPTAPLVVADEPTRAPLPPPAAVLRAAEAIADPALRARFLEAAAAYLTRFGGS